MAQADLSVVQDQFGCPICLDTLTDQVAIPCGHSFCLDCINRYWDRHDHISFYSCPQCKQTFASRPALGRNTELTDMEEKLKKIRLQARPVHFDTGSEEVVCDFCTGEKHKAFMSCLTCLASYCEAHLEPHYEIAPLKKHTLIRADRRLQDKLCFRHDKLLEVYCRTDQHCICYECLMSDHKGHDTVKAAVERTERQKNLSEMQNQYKANIQKREAEQQQVKEHLNSIMVSSEAAVQDIDKLFTELMDSIARRCSEQKELIRDEEKREVIETRAVLGQIEEEVAELKSGLSELERLSETEDHIHFLLRFRSMCSPPALGEVTSIPVPPLHFDILKQSVFDLKQRLNSVFQDGGERSWMCASLGDCSSIPDLKKMNHSGRRRKKKKATMNEIGQPAPVQEPTTREEFLQYACQLTFDSNSANEYVDLAPDTGKMLIMIPLLRDQRYPDHPDRFEHVQQVLCQEGLSTRCYWEVVWHGTHELYIAMAYKGISRKGKEKVSHFAHSSKAWCLKCTINSYSAWHNERGTLISTPKKHHRLGVYLDHSAGILSFYGVLETTMTLIHSFRSTFSEPLYFGLGGWGFGDCVYLCKMSET